MGEIFSLGGKGLVGAGGFDPQRFSGPNHKLKTCAIIVCNFLQQLTSLTLTTRTEHVITCVMGPAIALADKTSRDCSQIISNEDVTVPLPILLLEKICLESM